MSTFKMPERRPDDGPIGVERIGDFHLAVDVTTDGRAERVLMSEYNAARIFGCLAVMLGIDLPPKLGKAIKLGAASAEVGPKKAPTTLGERLANMITVDNATEKLKAAGFNVERVPAPKRKRKR